MSGGPKRNKQVSRSGETFKMATLAEEEEVEKQKKKKKLQISFDQKIDLCFVDVIVKEVGKEIIEILIAKKAIFCRAKAVMKQFTKP